MTSLIEHNQVKFKVELDQVLIKSDSPSLVVFRGPGAYLIKSLEGKVMED